MNQLVVEFMGLCFCGEWICEFQFICNVGGVGYGPSVIVRSIKAIERGEEVTIAYTDLLQPKVTCIFEFLYSHVLDFDAYSVFVGIISVVKTLIL